MLAFGNGIGDEGAERLHGGIVADVQEPQQQYGNPQCGNVRIEEQTQAATDGTEQEIRTAAAESGNPCTVAHGTDKGLHQQTGNRSCHIEVRQFCRVSLQETENRIDGGLLQTEAVLNAEEAEVHQHNLAKRQGYLWGNLHFEATPGLYKKKTWNNKLRETLHS